MGVDPELDVEPNEPEVEAVVFPKIDPLLRPGFPVCPKTEELEPNVNAPGAASAGAGAGADDLKVKLAGAIVTGAMDDGGTFG